MQAWPPVRQRLLRCLESVRAHVRPQSPWKAWYHQGNPSTLRARGLAPPCIRSRLSGQRSFGVAALLLIVILGVDSSYPASASSDAAPGRSVAIQGNAHLQSPGSPHPPYNSVPPTSGPHVPWLARWGTHRIPIPFELQVHNLEDGGVIIHYRCDQPCPDTVARLDALAGQYPTQVMVTPEPRLSSTIALTAWGRIDELDTVDEPRIRRFIDAYRGLDHHPPAEQPAEAPRPPAR